MKKLLLSSLAVVGLLGTTFAAQAEDDYINMSNPYAVMQAGYGFGHKDYKGTGVFALGGGYHMNEYLRADMTVGLRAWGEVKHDDTKVDTWSIPALANMYVTMPWRNMGIYAMGGLGMSYNKTDGSAYTRGDGKIDFAWTVGAGVDYRLNQCWSMDLGYRYIDLGEGRSKLKEDGVHMKKDFRSHDILLSARYHF